MNLKKTFDDIKNLSIVGSPLSKHVNSVFYLAEHVGDKPVWVFKFFEDALHPNIQIYDCAWREVFAYNLSKCFGDFIPQTYLYGKLNLSILSQHKGVDFVQYNKQYKEFPDANDTFLKQLATILVFCQWIGEHERTAEHLTLDDKDTIWSVDHSFGGPGSHINKEYSLQPWIDEEPTGRGIGKETIPFDHVEHIGHFRGVSNPDGNKKLPVGRLILDNYSRLLDFKYFKEIIIQIEKFDEQELRKIIEPFEFCQRRKIKDTSYEPMKDEGLINEIYYNQLVKGQEKIRNVFKQWIEWMKNQS